MYTHLDIHTTPTTQHHTTPQPQQNTKPHISPSELCNRHSARAKKKLASNTYLFNIQQYNTNQESIWNSRIGTLRPQGEVWACM